MINKNQFVIIIEKETNWLHEQHAWYIPLLKTPGIRLIQIRHEREEIERSAYHVNYNNQTVGGQAIQHFKTLHVQLCFTKRLSSWINVLLTWLAGLSGIIAFLAFSAAKPDSPVAVKKTPHDSTVLFKTEQHNDSAKPIPPEKQVAKKPPGSPPAKTSISSVSNTKVTNNPNQREVIVSIGTIPDSAGAYGNAVQEDAAMQETIAGILGEKQCVVYSSFFEPAIYTNGVFRQMRGNTFSAVSREQLLAGADELCIGTVWRNTSNLVTQKTGYKATINLHLKFISLETGKTIRSLDKTIIHPGSSAGQVLAEATEKLKQFLNDTL